jgi:hypothetical protein
VTTARECQVLNLVYLAPDIQEAVMFLPLPKWGRDAITFDALRAIALIPEWPQTMPHVETASKLIDIKTCDTFVSQN